MQLNIQLQFNFQLHVQYIPRKSHERNLHPIGNVNYICTINSIHMIVRSPICMIDHFHELLANQNTVKSSVSILVAFHI